MPSKQGCPILYSPHLQGLSSDLTRSPDTLEDLKFVLSAIAKIRSMSLEAEIQYRCVVQLY